MMDKLRIDQCVRVACLIAFAFTGCGRSPAIQFYTLHPIAADGHAAGAVTKDKLAVAVGPVELPRFLSQPQIAKRAGTSKVVYDEFHRWGESLNSDFSQVLGDNLAALLDTSRVVVYPTGAPYPLTYRVLVDVQDFTADQQGEVNLRARWTVVPGGGGPALAVEQSSIQIPAIDGDHDAVVAAHSQALGELSRSIAARIVALQGSRPND